MTRPDDRVARTIAPCGDTEPHGTHVWTPAPPFLHGPKRCPGVCEELRAHVAEHQYGALEMARKADAAERRALDAEAAIEATRDLLDGWAQDGPDDYAVHLLIRRVREMLALGERFRTDRGAER